MRPSPSSSCCGKLRQLWNRFTFPNFYYYPEDRRGLFATTTCCGEVSIWIIALTPALIMGIFLWGYTSILAAMLSFHFVSCIALPLVFVAAQDCRRDKRAVARFLRRKLALRNFVGFVPKPQKNQPCCARSVFEPVSVDDDDDDVNDEERGQQQQGQPHPSNASRASGAALISDGETASDDVESGLSLIHI